MEMQRTSQTTSPDNLLAGGGHITETVTILSGEGAVSRGQLLGKVCRQAGSAVAGANTGNGTVSGVSLGGKAKLGTYTLKCVATAGNGGTFAVIDPDGYALQAQATVGAAFTSGHLNFTINDGATDFALNDTFTIAVGSGSGKFRKYNSANADGSQYPSAILATDVDATAADKPADAYLAGAFRAESVTGYSNSLKDGLRSVGVVVKTNG